MDVKVEPMEEDVCFNNNNNNTSNNKEVLTRTPVPHVFSIERLLQTKSPAPAQDSVAHLQRLARLADAIGAGRRDVPRRASLSPLTVVVHADSSQRRDSTAEDEEPPGDPTSSHEDEEDDPDDVHGDLGDDEGDSSVSGRRQREAVAEGSGILADCKRREYEVHCGEVSTSSHKGESGARPSGGCWLWKQCRIEQICVRTKWNRCEEGVVDIAA